MLTTPLTRIEEALLHLQYALADYYASGEQNSHPGFNCLEAPLYGLRINLDSTLSAINHSAAKAETANAAR
jgi:hypothetical protein